MKWIFLIGISISLIGCMQQPGVLVRFKNRINTKAELGEKLFFDTLFSLDYSISCASCHNPKYAFADNKAFSEGVNHQLGTRNTPSVMNMGSRSFFFHDGRAKTLEEQAVMPVENPIEMNLPFAEAVKRINANEEYVRLFKKIYRAKPNQANITHAIATFERSLESDGSAPHDRWMNGNEDALTESQKRGRKLFLSDKSKCFDCHFSPDFTFDEFRNIGLYDGKSLNDKGRFEVTKDPKDLGKFKVPGLRNVALTAPYMHNGMFNTLEEVVEFYSNPYAFVKNPLNIDSILVQPIHFTKQEKEDLVNYLHALTDETFPYPRSKK